jgi:hypothetical protein
MTSPGVESPAVIGNIEETVQTVQTAATMHTYRERRSSATVEPTTGIGDPASQHAARPIAHHIPGKERSW